MRFGPSLFAVGVAAVFLGLTALGLDDAPFAVAGVLFAFEGDAFALVSVAFGFTGAAFVLGLVAFGFAGAAFALGLVAFGFGGAAFVAGLVAFAFAGAAFALGLVTFGFAGAAFALGLAAFAFDGTAFAFAGALLVPVRVRATLASVSLALDRAPVAFERAPRARGVFALDGDMISNALEFAEYSHIKQGVVYVSLLRGQ
jgi:hypothetical protein